MYKIRKYPKSEQVSSKVSKTAFGTPALSLGKIASVTIAVEPAISQPSVHRPFRRQVRHDGLLRQQRPDAGLVRQGEVSRWTGSSARLDHREGISADG